MESASQAANNAITREERVAGRVAIHAAINTRLRAEHTHQSILFEDVRMGCRVNMFLSRQIICYTFKNNNKNTLEY